MDAAEGVTEQDTKIAGYVHEECFGHRDQMGLDRERYAYNA